MGGDYQRAVGARLRMVRQQQQLTLREVEARSGGVWRAVVVGSYERGDRAMSIAKLQGLAEFYGVPISELLPPDGMTGGSGAPPANTIVDVAALRRTKAADELVQILRRMTDRIQSERQDYNGQVLSLRAPDVLALVTVLGCSTAELLDELHERGLLVENSPEE